MTLSDCLILTDNLIRSLPPRCRRWRQSCRSTSPRSPTPLTRGGSPSRSHLSLLHTLSLYPSLALSLSHLLSHTHSHTHALSLSLTHSFSLSLSLTHTLSLSHAHTHTLSLQGNHAHDIHPTPWDHHRPLGIGLLQGPTGRWFLISEVPLYCHLSCFH